MQMLPLEDRWQGKHVTGLKHAVMMQVFFAITLAAVGFSQAQIAFPGQHLAASSPTMGFLLSTKTDAPPLLMRVID